MLAKKYTTTQPGVTEQSFYICEPLKLKDCPFNTRLKFTVDIDCTKDPELACHFVGDAEVCARLMVTHYVNIDFKKANYGLPITIDAYNRGETSKKNRVFAGYNDVDEGFIKTACLPDVIINKNEYPQGSIFYYPFVTTGNMYQIQLGNNEYTDIVTYTDKNLFDVGELYIEEFSPVYDSQMFYDNNNFDQYKIKYSTKFNLSSYSFINKLRQNNYHAGLDIKQDSDYEWFLYKTQNPQEIESLIDFTKVYKDINRVIFLYLQLF